MIKRDQPVIGRDLECVERGVLSLCPIYPLIKRYVGRGNTSPFFYKYVWNFDVFRHCDKKKIYRLLQTEEKIPKFVIQHVELLLLLLLLLLLFMVLISLVSVLNLLYFYISTFRSMCTVHNIFDGVP